MMFYMDSRVFAELYLDNESDKDILRAQYVVISYRIRRRSSETVGEKERWPNISIQAKLLMPDRETMSAADSESFLMKYYDQLEEYRGYLAYLVNAVVRDPSINIIFLSSENESKRYRYLSVLAEYIYETFGYPCYNYKLYVYGCDLISYDPKKVLQKTQRAITVSRKERQMEFMRQGNTKRLMEEYARMTKKDLKRMLQKEDLYEKAMTRKEMLEACRLFLT